jgi:hypothetical protein
MVLMKNKMAYRALFTPGTFVDIDVELSNIVEAFASGVLNTPQRKRLASQLRFFIAYLQNLGLASFEMWIDGSFTTMKPDPMDIDVVCFVAWEQLDLLSDENLHVLQHFGSEEGRPYVREKWSIDFYIGRFDSIVERNLWKDKFSRDEYSEPKGIGRIRI